MAQNFLGIGAMRAGTTWTWRCMREHSQIAFPGGKQIHFWDKHRDRGVGWYRNTLDSPTGVLSGEITPAYAILADDAVREIAEEFPALRLFFVLRNPVDRAWSSAQLHIKRNELDPSTIDNDWYRQRLDGSGIRKRNQYANTVERWTAAFSEGQMIVLGFEQLRREPERFLARIARHIGADPMEFLSPSPAMAAQIGTARNATSGEMPEALRAFAAELYADELAWFERFDFAPLD